MVVNDSQRLNLSTGGRVRQNQLFLSQKRSSRRRSSLERSLMVTPGLNKSLRSLTLNLPLSIDQRLRLKSRKKLSRSQEASLGRDRISFTRGRTRLRRRRMRSPKKLLQQTLKANASVTRAAHVGKKRMMKSLLSSHLSIRSTQLGIGEGTRRTRSS